MTIQGRFAFLPLIFTGPETLFLLLAKSVGEGFYFTRVQEPFIFFNNSDRRGGMPEYKR